MSRRRTATWEDYGMWIATEYVHMEDAHKYVGLILKLHSISFDIFVESDDDREGDGLYLRNYFIEDNPKKIIDDEILENECSVLEVLAALAVRLDHEYIGDHMVERPEDYDENLEYRLFTEMLDNLELLDYEDDITPADEDEIVSIIDLWLSRSFDRKGGGSIFPMRHTKRDQRKLSIWEQAMEYITENY